MKAKTKQTFCPIADRLAREQGYPHVKLSYHQYMKVLKEAERERRVKP